MKIKQSNGNLTSICKVSHATLGKKQNISDILAVLETNQMSAKVIEILNLRVNGYLDASYSDIKKAVYDPTNLIDKPNACERLQLESFVNQEISIYRG